MKSFWKLVYAKRPKNYHPSELHKLLFPRKRSPNSSELFAWNSNFPTSFSITCWLASQNKVKLACDHSGISATQEKKKTDIKFLCLKLRKKTFMVIAHFQKFSKIRENVGNSLLPFFPVLCHVRNFRCAQSRERLCQQA